MKRERPDGGMRGGRQGPRILEYRPDSEALIFSPQLPYVAQARGEEFTISFARLRPFLTEEGAQNLRALRAETNGDRTGQPRRR